MRKRERERERRVYAIDRVIVRDTIIFEKREIACDKTEK
jgi:hypothetical protein